MSDKTNKESKISNRAIEIKKERTKLIVVAVLAGIVGIACLIMDLYYHLTYGDSLTAFTVAGIALAVLSTLIVIGFFPTEKRVNRAAEVQQRVWESQVNAEVNKMKSQVAPGADPQDVMIGNAMSSASVNTKQTNNDASVVKRAAAGAVVAGPVGAVVGAISAVDKNNKNRK